MLAGGPPLSARRPAGRPAPTPTGPDIPAILRARAFGLGIPGFFFRGVAVGNATRANLPGTWATQMGAAEVTDSAAAAAAAAAKLMAPPAIFPSWQRPPSVVDASARPRIPSSSSSPSARLLLMPPLSLPPLRSATATYYQQPRSYWQSVRASHRRGKNVPAIYDKTNLGRFLHRGGANKRSSGMMMAGIRNARRGVGNGGDRSGLSLPQAGGRLQRQDAKKKKDGMTWQVGVSAMQASSLCVAPGTPTIHSQSRGGATHPGRLDMCGGAAGGGGGVSVCLDLGPD
ncbi:hypothetical protein PCL_05828 [Purpureocillium lilacinum]|uniref:Uncharacterized protein n=1 Tax=Purpureocillium lilacinum TaxID=33203 RepID=A0A2U3EL49_PURLI|nr:hypothetical protein PCL_05828 [Purpureocillium lilacinum]